MSINRLALNHVNELFLLILTPQILHNNLALVFSCSKLVYFSFLFNKVSSAPYFDFLLCKYTGREACVTIKGHCYSDYKSV